MFVQIGVQTKFVQISVCTNNWKEVFVISKTEFNKDIGKNLGYFGESEVIQGCRVGMCIKGPWDIGGGH